MPEEPTGKTLRRRGILAAATAVVAGIVAKGTVQPVAASSDASFIATGAGAGNADFDARGAALFGISTLGGTFDTGVNGYGTSTGVYGFGHGGYGVRGDSTTGTAIYGFTTGAGIQRTGSNLVTVLGSNTAIGSNNIGVQGESVDGYGVYGDSGNYGYGVYGTNVFGYGVYGTVTGGVGAQGTSQNIGVRGQITGSSANTVAVQGTNSSTGSGGIGVRGNSVTGSGVIGQSDSGLGMSAQGGLAPIRLVPGATAGGNLAASGHQVGELYVTSDHRLFFFDGTAWQEVAFVPPNAAPQAQPVATIQPAAPAPIPASQPSGTSVPSTVPPIPVRRP